MTKNGSQRVPIRSQNCQKWLLDPAFQLGYLRKSLSRIFWSKKSQKDKKKSQKSVVTRPKWVLEMTLNPKIVKNGYQGLYSNWAILESHKTTYFGCKSSEMAQISRLFSLGGAISHFWAKNGLGPKNVDVIFFSRALQHLSRNFGENLSTRSFLIRWVILSSWCITTRWQKTCIISKVLEPTLFFYFIFGFYTV